MESLRVCQVSIVVSEEDPAEARVFGSIELRQSSRAYEVALRLAVHDSRGLLLADVEDRLPFAGAVDGRLAFDRRIRLGAAPRGQVRVDVIASRMVPPPVRYPDCFASVQPAPYAGDGLCLAFHSGKGRWVLARKCSHQVLADSLRQEASASPTFPSSQVQLSTVTGPDQQAFLVIDVDAEGLYRCLLIGYNGHGPVVAFLVQVLGVSTDTARKLVGHLHAPAPAGYAKVNWPPFG